MERNARIAVALYRRLLRLYPRDFRDRFGESMEQTFNDLLHARGEAKRSVFVCALAAFAETSAAIVRENMTSFIARSTTQRLVVWGIVVALILTVLATIPLTDEVQWNEAVAYIVLLLAGGGAYEMLQWLKTRDRTYRAAFGVGLGGALLLGWINGAVGIIGSEDNPANLMYGAVFAVGFTGSLAARFRPRGMARTLFAAAAAQLLVPVTALVISPTVSWGDAGLLGVFVLNAVFATFFAGSALLFRRASHSIAVRRDVL